MSKRKWFGLALLGAGSLLGFVFGGMFGLGLAAVCLVCGLVLLASSATAGSGQSSMSSGSTSSKPTFLVLVKEVHARPQHLGKFREIQDPEQSGLQYEMFVHCWLVNDSDARLSIQKLQVALTPSRGPQIVLPRIHGDLNRWSLGRLRDELDTWGVRYLQAAQEKMHELDLAEPVEAGASQQGWIHVQAENLTPRQLQSSSLAVTVLDSTGHSHFGTAGSPLQIPGRVWPLPGITGEPASTTAPSRETAPTPSQQNRAAS